MEPRVLSRRRFLAWGAATLGGAAVGSGVWQTYDFRVVNEQTQLPGLRQPLRAVWMCDFHFGPYLGAGSVRAWVDSAIAVDPDVILLGGDLVDRAAGDVAPLLQELARLRAPLGVFAVWGNHDHARFAPIEPFGTMLEGIGVDVLVNRGVRLRDDLYLAGLAEFRHGRPDIELALAAQPDGTASLLLTHNPDVLPRVPEGVGLTLAGHTHGGQIHLPGIGPVMTSSRYGRRFAQGWVEGPARGYVSRGLGVGFVPLRFACPAELTVLDLVPGPGTAG